MTTPTTRPPFFNRWWTYQAERFPLKAHGPLIAAFSFSAVAFSTLVRGAPQALTFSHWLVAFITALAFFAQLRIADEFKDHEEDCRYRPYRAVPRGLIHLRELAILGLLLAAVQAALALWLAPQLLWLLALTWGYLGLMSVEFFAPAWLKARPLVYLFSHMLIMPLIDLYATACDWLVLKVSLPQGLYWFILVSFCNGIVIEIGRKIRAPADEEPGVETYSVLWGAPGAIAGWWLALLTTTLFALGAAWQIDFLLPVAVVLTTLLLAAAWQSWRFLARPIAGRGKGFELLAGLWTLAMYLAIGAGPFLLTLEEFQWNG